jgi:hypothetical protein
MIINPITPHCQSSFAIFDDYVNRAHEQVNVIEDNHLVQSHGSYGGSDGWLYDSGSLTTKKIPSFMTMAPLTDHYFFNNMMKSKDMNLSNMF